MTWSNSVSGVKEVGSGVINKASIRVLGSSEMSNKEEIELRGHNKV